jgi:hypothetical protein
MGKGYAYSLHRSTLGLIVNTEEVIGCITYVLEVAENGKCGLNSVPWVDTAGFVSDEALQR